MIYEPHGYSNVLNGCDISGIIASIDNESIEQVKYAGPRPVQLVMVFHEHSVSIVENETTAASIPTRHM